MGVPLSSPKQPQLASGRRCRISFSAPTATRTNSAVPVRTTVAGKVGQSRPNFTAVPISPRPRPSSAAVLGISLGTVKSTVSRAVAKLRIDAELAEDSGA